MKTRKAQGSRRQINGKMRVTYVDARTLKPSDENSMLYRDRTDADKDFARLKESIRKQCVQNPLIVSQDGFIISGHQRRKGAIETGRFMVPVIICPIRRSSHTEDEWLAILREHNTGREKSFDELVREGLVDIDPDEAISLIVDDRIERSCARIPTIKIGEREMRRCEISEAKTGMLNAILEVLRDLNDYLPVSLRAIHYRLLVKRFFRHALKRTPYQNDLPSYKDLSDVATRMRLTGQIPWDSIRDETRPVTSWRCWRNAADFMTEEAEGLFKGFARDLLQSQQCHFEIVAEKLTVKNFVNPIAARYCMQVVIMRGNSSIDARHQLVERFRRSGKHKLFLFCLGDCDPDGDSIVDSTLRSLRDDFQLRNVQGTRVAMTHEQADRLRLPRMLQAKKQSPNYAAFKRKHGRTDCYELEAVAPEVLQEWLDKAIKGVIDVEAYNHEVDQQTKEATSILARRQAVLQLLRN